jgi:hypothetical protein
MTDIVHLTKAQMQALIRPGNLSTNEERLQRDHLFSCAQCQETLRTLPECQLMDQLLARDLFAPHLTYADKSAYLDGQLTETQQRNVERHLEICSWCRARVESLRSIDQEVTNRPNRSNIPLPILSSHDSHRVHVLFRRRNLVPSVCLILMCWIIILGLKWPIMHSFNAKAALSNAGIGEDSNEVLAALPQAIERTINMFDESRGASESSLVQLTPSNEFVLSQSPLLRWSTPQGGVYIEKLQVLDEGHLIESVTNPIDSYRVKRQLSGDHLYTWQLQVQYQGQRHMVSKEFYIPNASVIGLLSHDMRSLSALQRATVYVKAGQLQKAKSELVLASAKIRNPDERRAIDQALALLNAAR